MVDVRAPLVVSEVQELVRALFRLIGFGEDAATHSLKLVTLKYGLVGMRSAGLTLAVGCGPTCSGQLPLASQKRGRPWQAAETVRGRLGTSERERWSWRE
jgi:hypothetical protein